MAIKPLLTMSFCMLAFLASGQQHEFVKNLETVAVKGYHNQQPLLRAVAAVSLIDSSQLAYSSSLVRAANTASGVRFEERSPGSYRFSLRGSLLRSPFGIRNIKIYVDDFPLTDAGGNTYLNLLDIKGVNALEIYKGPEASIFGANTGGAVILSSPTIHQNRTELGILGGSDKLFGQHVSISRQKKRYRFNITEGYQHSTGYRENSAFSRKFLQTTHQWAYAQKAQLNALTFISDLRYQTPGGLTLTQTSEDPRMARPATATLPSVVRQQAAIYNKTLFGGLSHTYQLGPKWKHLLATFGSYSDFQNPFITNYEKRYENTLGLRTFLEFSAVTSKYALNLQFGAESALTTTRIGNFDNKEGEAGDLQAKDRLRAAQTFLFIRANYDLGKRLLLELGSSLNRYGYRYESYFPLAVSEKQKKFGDQLMPKVALSYLVLPTLALRGSISKGYSPPSLAEVRASDNAINTGLQAEYGWNTELGLRLKSINNRFYANLNVFSYQLRDAIVRRLDHRDQEYFLNAGGTKQQGLEIDFSFWLLPHQNHGTVNSLKWTTSITHHNFRFNNFINGANNFSGNKLTGVPKNTLATHISATLAKRSFLLLHYQYTSSIPLNDANTDIAKPYQLLDLNVGLKNLRLGKLTAEPYAAVNNLLNQHYSLGNDLNALGGRYYNPATTINFQFGLLLKL